MLEAFLYPQPEDVGGRRSAPARQLTATQLTPPWTYYWQNDILSSLWCKISLTSLESQANKAFYMV